MSENDLATVIFEGKQHLDGTVLLPTWNRKNVNSRLNKINRSGHWIDVSLRLNPRNWLKLPTAISF